MIIKGVTDMIKHVVMWKFKPGTEKEMHEFISGLRDLYGVIPQILQPSRRLYQVSGAAELILSAACMTLTLRPAASERDSPMQKLSPLLP